VDKVRAEGKKASGKKPMIRVSVSTFVPKPHTPFQWAARLDEQALHPRLEILRQGLNIKGVKFSWHDPRIGLLEAALSRGDRRTGKAIYRAWELGCRFDAWTEHYNHEKWLQAFADAGLEPGFYAYRERSTDEVLPWSHIDAGVSEAFLKQELRRALEERDTPDCRISACNTCGLEQTESCLNKRRG
jgi:radical SAM superfamily enzyme YgiQ (UPF0313 family)